MANKLYYGDVTIGQSLPVLVKHPTTRQLVMWAGAAEEFYEAHYDKDFAISKGLPGVIVHGMLMTSFLGQLVTDWIGDEGTLKRFRANYLAIVYPNRDMFCKGTVTRKYIENGENLVDCDIWLEKENGEKVVSGGAIVALPALTS
jgi:acyl dehydratase